MRILGIDVGRKRIGLAISDPSGTLARPLSTLTVGAHDGVRRVLQEVERLSGEEDAPHVEAFISSLSGRTAIPILVEDERLSSREAESRLARRETDWRKRKARLDAAAAAVILQDYLDRRPQADR